MSAKNLDQQAKSEQTAAAALRSVALPDICQVHDLALLTGIPAPELERAFERGELPGRKLAGRWMVARPALLEFFSEWPSRRPTLRDLP
jgi:hypothetical protein